MNVKTIAIAAALTACAAVTATAGSSNSVRPAKWVDGHYVAQSARGEAAGQIIRKFAGYVQKVYGVTPGKWASAMAASFAQADVRNMQRAAKMDTYEAMMATLLGQQTTDETVIDKMARSDGSLAAAQLLGSPSEDLVYTAIQPCRIVD